MSASHPRSSKCGPHVELASNDVARVMRCPCGTVHLHLHPNGVSLRMNADSLRHVANALGAASRLVDMVDGATTPSDAVN